VTERRLKLKRVKEGNEADQAVQRVYASGYGAGYDDGYEAGAKEMADTLNGHWGKRLEAVEKVRDRLMGDNVRLSAANDNLRDQMKRLGVQLSYRNLRGKKEWWIKD
jgi:flagellar biosynthesis/type III secretory pathway protein FliH